MQNPHPPDLTSAIAHAWTNATRDNPDPTVTYFKDLLTQYPDSPKALYEYASALDFAGREAEAAPLYEQAFEAGLKGDDLRRGLLQYGSTLRNLHRHDEAVAILERAIEQFPDSDSVKAFHALALLSAGEPNAAVAALLILAVDKDRR